MRRLLIIAFVLMCAVAPWDQTRAAPIPKDAEKPIYYYPTKVGTKWVYEEPSGDVRIVSKVEDRKGTKIISVDRVSDDGNRQPFQIVEVSAAGLQRTQFLSLDLKKPEVLLKAPFKAGERWDFDDPRVEGESMIFPGCKGTYIIAGEETIKVPAGTFKAIRVVRECTYETKPDSRLKFTAWYAPDVGLVKMVNGDGKAIVLLESFTPTKE